MRIHPPLWPTEREYQRGGELPKYALTYAFFLVGVPLGLALIAGILVAVLI